jgi:hypothetical protein
MSTPHQHPRGQRQLAGLAASGSLVFYVVIVLAVALVVAGVAAFQLLGLAQQ